MDNSLVTLIGDFLTNSIFVVGDEDALAMTAVLGIELHGGVKGGA